MELRMYQFRLYPSNKHILRLFSAFDACKDIYNSLLETSIKTYTDTKKTLRKFDFNKTLTGTHLELHSQVRQNVSDRVHKAFANFFRRVKDPACKKKGFPRFKSRVQSITYPQSGFKFLSNKRLQVSKIGSMPIVLHRLPKGKIKTMTIKRNKVGQWFATFACEVDTKPVKYSNKTKIGIDVGLEHFATLSTGEMIDNPCWLRASECKLKRLQRIMSRRIKGSHNRAKARFKVAKCHLKIANQRDDFLHKLSRTLTQKYGEISVEALTIKNMVKNHYLAKSISDAAWGKFFQFLSYKAVTSGGLVEKKDPRNTSKTCSSCGTIIKMPLSKRQFKCPNCGFVCHRDLNASINIRNGMGGLPKTLTPVEIPPLPLSFAKASGIVESGTTYEQ